MRHFAHDLRLAIRRLRQQPGFSFVAVLTLALGIGANTTVFTLVHALILRSLPVARPHELYRLGDSNDCCVNSGFPGNFSLFSFRLFEHLRNNTPEFTELAGFQANTSPWGLRRPGEAVAKSLPGAFVTANYFTMFGVHPAAGRLLRPEDDLPGAAPVAVMSHWAWTQVYGQDPAIVGGAMIVSGKPMTIVGVAAPQFFGDTVRPDPAAIWLPIGQEPMLREAASLIERADQNWLYAIGRIAAGARPEAIAVRTTTLLQQWLSAQPFVPDRFRSAIAQQRIAVVAAGGGVGAARAQYSRSLTLLFAASAMVLLIAIANLANLLLSRADPGQTAIRAALGASRRRLIQHALTEGIMLAMAGGLLGVGIASLSTRALIKIVFPLVAHVPVPDAPSAWVWLFALALSIVTGALFTAVPAWAMSRTAPLDALSGVGRSGHARSFVPRGSLLIVQVALSVVLLASAGLLAKSLGNLERQPLGFAPADRLIVRIDPPPIAGDIPRLDNLFRRIEEQLGNVPGVARIGYSMYSPMEGNNWSSAINIAGRKSDPDRPDASSWNRVSGRYFETVGTRVLRGRGIDERDTPSAKRVAVVSEAFARRFLPDSDPIGRTVGFGDASHAGDFEIVGVVEDVKYTGASDPNVRPMLFLPSFQTVEYADTTNRNVQARSTLMRTIVVRMAPSAENVEAGIRQALADVDPDLNVIRVLPMTLQVSGNFRLERLMAELTTVYGLLALALASLGLYGVTAYGVAQRTREIGVRMALGASGARVIRTCVAGPLLQTAVGLGLGLTAAFFVARALRTQLYGIDKPDPMVLVAAVFALLASAVAAGVVPARRAARVNPASALRAK